MFTLLFSLNAQADAAHYQVGVGDVLSVNVYRSPDLKTDVQVPSDGKINFPLIGKVEVLDKTTAEIEAAITKELIDQQLLVSPQVNVLILEYRSKTFSVFGHVTTPGKFPIDRPLKLTDAIGVAGGYTLTASDFVTVVSQVDGQITKQVYNVKEIADSLTGEGNPLIKNGDIVQVPKHDVFYIHGHVNSPGEYKIEPNMRVSQGLAMGGGVSLRGTTRSMTIERTDSKGEVTEIKAKLGMKLQPNDVIFVDESLF